MSERKKTSLRVVPDAHRTLKQRAAAAGLSLNAYLIECGLSEQHRPDPASRAARERAVFELHEIKMQLEHLAHTLTLSSVTDEKLRKQFFQALNSVIGAALLFEESYRNEILVREFAQKTHNSDSESPTLFKGDGNGTQSGGVKAKSQATHAGN